MKTLQFLVVLYIVLLFCIVGNAQNIHEGDFELKVEFDSIIVEPRVLRSELKEEEFFSTDEPGFASEPNTFPYPSRVGFNILFTLSLT